MEHDCDGGPWPAGERVDATATDMNTGTGRDKGYTGRQVRNYNGRGTGWRRPKSGQLYGRAHSLGLTFRNNLSPLFSAQL